MAQKHPTNQYQDLLKRVPAPPIANQVVIALGATVATLAVQGLGLLQLMEWAILDQWFRWQPTEVRPVPIVVVAIDDEDIAEIGNWPLTDGQLAAFLTQLNSYKPSAIGLNLYRDLSIEPGQMELKQFFEATPHLIGVEKLVGEGSSTAIPPDPTLQELGQVAFNDLMLDSDGHIRRHLLSMQPGNETALALGTRIALLHLEQQFQILPEALDNSHIQLGKTELSPIRANAGAYVEADIGGYQILANYFQPSSKPIPTVSYQAVLEGEIPPELLNEAIVFVGLKANSAWGDRFYTPFSNSSDETWSGVEIHAQLTAQLVAGALTGRAPLRSLPEFAEWLWILGWASIGVACNRRLLMNSRLLRLPLFIGLLTASTYGLFLAHYWVPLLAPLLALQGAWLATQGYSIWHRLRYENRILEMAVAERTQQLQTQNKDLDQARIDAEKASQAKGMFLAHMSHELRTPLTAILGFGDLLERSPDLPTEEKSYAETIKRCGNHLLTMINNVLELSRMEAEAEGLTLVPMHLPTFCYETEYMFKAQAQAKQLSLSCHFKSDLNNNRSGSNTSAWIEVDEAKLRQIIVNLLGNAIKFTKVGHIQLTATLKSLAKAPLLGSALSAQPSETAIENNGSAGREVTLECTIQDTGPGLSEQEIEQLFQPFVQTKAGKNLGKGTGLGLSLVAQWVKLMNGTITVNATPGKGSCFVFDIPVMLTTEPATSNMALKIPAETMTKSMAKSPVQRTPQPTPTAEQDYRILIVDDEDDNRRLLAHWLTEASFTIQTADTGTAALEKAESWQPHLILLDVHLPDCDGYEVARLIRQQGERQSERQHEKQRGKPGRQLATSLVATEEPVILAITAGALKDRYADLLAAGCDDVLWKPIRVETLLFKMSEYL